MTVEKTETRAAGSHRRPRTARRGHQPTERADIAALGLAASAEVGLDRVYELVANRLAEIIAFDHAAISTIRQDGRLEVSYVSGVAARGWEAGTVHDAPTDFMELISEPDDTASAASWLQAPLGDPGNPSGYLTIASSTHDAYTTGDRETLAEVATHVGPAIRNAALYAKTLAEADEARLLADISRAAIAGLDIPGLAARFLEMVRNRVPFERGTLRLVDVVTGAPGAGASLGLGSDLPLPSFRSRSVTEAMALGRLVEDVDVEPEEPTPAAPLARLGLRSAVTLPLSSNEHVVGVVTLRRIAADGFRTDEIEFLARACAQIAPAVDNARLLAEVSALASTVRNSPDFIFSAELDGRTKYLNPAGRAAAGIASDYDVTQLTWDDYFTEEDAARLREVGVVGALKRGSWHGELSLKARDGSILPVDCVVVPVHHRNGTLLGVTLSARDIADRKRSEAELHELATTDTLTGLLNRRQFLLMLEQALKLAVPRGSTGTLIFLDLDGFKYVNDTHGHSVGDSLLIAVAETLNANVRASDVVARTGGDEFLVILRDAAAEEGLEKARQLVKAVADTHATVGSESVNTTCSAGVVSFPFSDASAEDLVAFADLALYHAKDAGRNRVHAYDPSEGSRELATSMQNTRRMIVDALAANRLRLFWQPIVGVETREVAMHEVLVRLEDAEGQVHQPMDFIPQAETLDVVHLIDRRVIELSFERWRRYADAGQKLKLCVNVSGRSMDTEIAGYIISMGSKYGVTPRDISFEITETATWRGGRQATEFGKALNEAGYRISIDDFGSGATSFKQIRALPFHYLKLDGSLVENLKDGRHDRELVRSLSGMAHTLGVEVIAEYVRDNETMLFLESCGIEYAQGYFLGKPTEFPEGPSG